MIARSPRPPQRLRRSRATQRGALGAYIPSLVLEGAQRVGGRPQWLRELRGALLIADVSGFTRLSDAMALRGRAGAERLIATLNSYYACVLAEVARHGGEPLRFGGDSLVALFCDESIAIRSNARNALACAAAIHTALARRRPLAAEFGGHRLQVSIGVHAGSLMLASGGEPEDGLHFALLGADVGTAVRGQDLASAGETLASREALLAAGVAVRDGLEEWLPAPAFDRAAMPQSEAGELPTAGLRSHRGVTSTNGAGAYLDPLLVTRLAARAPDERDGEHRPVTALFVQLDGLHAALQDLRAQGDHDAAAEFSRLVRTIAASVRRSGGIVLGFDPTPSGLKALAVFGLLQTSPQDAARAATAGAALRSSLRRLPDGVSWRAGLSGGTVFAGDLGAGARRDYTVLGDVVNIAARLAATAAAGQVVAHAALAANIETAVRIRPLAPMSVKGKPEPLERIAVLDAVPEPARQAQAAHELLGREAELARLWAMARGLEGSAIARTVVITGPAGIGKSALLEAFAAEWRRYGLRVLGESGAEPLEGRQYRAWLSCLRALFGIRPGDGRQRAVSKIETTLSTCSPGDEQWAALLGGLLGIQMADERTRGMDPQSLLRLQHRLVARCLAGCAADRPLLVVLDPLNAGDDGSHSLLQHLRVERPAAPLLIIAGARTDAPDGTFDETLRLNGLPDAALAELAARVVGASLLDDPVIDWLQRHTGGNPLFAEQLARVAARDGHVQVLPGRGICVPVGDLADVPVPDSVQPLLLGDVDALAPAERRVVQAAAVCGAEIDEHLLAAAEPHIAPLELRAILERLKLTRILLNPKGRRPAAFREPLLREAVYESLPTVRRRRLHRRIAEWIASHESSGGDPELVALHYARAGDPRLVDSALAAARLARERGDGYGALRLYRLVLDAPARISRRRPAELSEALLAAADVEHDMTSRYDSALVLVRRALRLTRRLAEPQRARVEAAAEFRMGRALHRLGAFAAARRWLLRVSQALPTSPSLRTDVLLERSMLAYEHGRTAEALTLCDAAAREASDFGEDRLQARVVERRGVILSGIGRHAEAALALEQAAEYFAGLGDPFWEASARMNLGGSYFWLGRWREAEASYRQARELERRVGDADRTLQATLNLGEVMGCQGRVDEALALFAECRAAWQRSGFVLGVAHADLFTGETLARDLQPSEASAALQAATNAFRELRLDGLASHAAASLAEVLADAGDVVAAREVSALALSLAERVDSIMYDAYAARAVGFVAPEVSRGLRLLRASVSRFERSDMVYEAARARVRLALRLLELHQRRSVIQARRALQVAAAEFARLGAASELRRASAALNDVDAALAERRPVVRRRPGAATDPAYSA